MAIGLDSQDHPWWSCGPQLGFSEVNPSMVYGYTVLSMGWCKMRFTWLMGWFLIGFSTCLSLWPSQFRNVSWSFFVSISLLLFLQSASKFFPPQHFRQNNGNKKKQWVGISPKHKQTTFTYFDHFAGLFFQRHRCPGKHFSLGSGQRGSRAEGAWRAWHCKWLQ